VVYAKLVLACEYPHDVESQRVELRITVGEVLFGEGAEHLLLAGGDGFQRVAEACTASQLHFHEDEGVGSKVQTPSAPELAFQAFLAQDGAQRLELARA
jgi:hypothetical protein